MGCSAGVKSAAATDTSNKPKKWGKSRPYYGKVVAVEGLCQLAATDDKDTIRVEVDLGDSGLQYTPGDALGVYPLNCPQVHWFAPVLRRGAACMSAQVCDDHHTALGQSCTCPADGKCSATAELHELGQELTAPQHRQSMP